ncbi:hypothetical protein RchiOBHm_Chr5g0013471 [Rosa chinensis]|uniref:Uncharacterized protein n=1 Tax=Rosa chinensis TaxID=74649 RepID=A0A2P6Q5G1_ROSCH|nr:hypothetical protein RchiOBHm_Chr5g0013471 [Rosa chinensis]
MFQMHAVQNLPVYRLIDLPPHYYDLANFPQVRPNIVNYTRSRLFYSHLYSMRL